MKFAITTICILISVCLAKVEKRKETGCEIVKGVLLSFYGKEEESGAVAYSECGRINAGGRGTYDSPLTMASAPGAFSKCEVLFVPYLLKYVRFEDICTDCVKAWAKGKLHMQIWTGSDLSGGSEQSDCERELAPTHGMAVIRNPGSDYRLDTTPLYARGATDPCRMDHRYSMLNNDVFCYGRRDKTAGKKRKKPAATVQQGVLVDKKAATVKQQQQPVSVNEEEEVEEDEDDEADLTSLPVLAARPVLAAAKLEARNDLMKKRRPMIVL